ncbi:NIS1 (YNL078W) [Zygosaccharomyces parabailii]|nr:NIS1 (YNL078W) [Zygosaccharomyces parabailii]
MPASQDTAEPLLASRNSVRIDPTSTRRRKKQQQEHGRRGNLLSRFSRWDQYKQSSTGGSSSAQRTILGNGLGRRASVRRTDFTNKKELDRFSKERRFIFHRGFLKRNARQGSINARYRDNRPRLKNSAELNSALQYVDLSTMEPEEVMPAKDVISFKPVHLRQRTAAVIASSTTPLDEYVRVLGTKASVKRSSPATSAPLERKIPRTTASISVRRSLTTPASINSRRSYSSHRQKIEELWKEYLFLVISQRLQLRISLLRDIDNNISQRSIPFNAKESRKMDYFRHNDNPLTTVTSGDDVEEASISSLVARRKAL